MNIRVSVTRTILVAFVTLVAAGAAGQNPSSASPAPMASSLTVDALVRRALGSNPELAAARIEVQRARSRMRQAGLLDNPVLEIEQTGGPPLGSKDEDQELRSEISIPIPYGGKRGSRVEVARMELHAAEREFADRERRFIAELRRLYVEAAAATRELSFTNQLAQIDAELGVVLEVRVKEGDAPPLEASLLRVEIDRLRSRRAILEGRRRAAELQLAYVVGLQAGETTDLGETYGDRSRVPAIGELVRLAKQRRPDLQFADLNIKAAQAGLRLARAEALPDFSAFGSYQSITNEVHPAGIVTDYDKLYSAGVAISLPIFDRNQGRKAEARAVIEQFTRLRELKELQIRAEVESAFARFQASDAAVEVFRQGVIERSEQNVRTMRAAYEAGAFTISEFLAERRRLVDAQRELIEALTERAIALIDLQAAVAEPIEINEESK